MDWGFYYDPVAGPALRRRVDRGQRRAGVRRADKARRLLHLPPLRHAQHRAAHRLLPGHRAGLDPARALLPHVPDAPGHGLRLRLAGAEAGRRDALVSRRRRLRGPLLLRGHEPRAGVGRLDVRGADGAAAGARGAVGPAVVGRQPPAVRAGRRSTTGWRRPATATGASRPPTTRTAATASTASTRSAWTRPATRPTRSARRSTSATRAAARRSRRRRPTAAAS